MYIGETNSRGKYTCYLLRESYREDRKVKRRTIANLSHCSKEEIEAMRLALKHKKDLSELVSVKETIHSRYKDLAQVEWAFRTSKTVHLEMRPVNVRLASRTRGHVFVVMLAYRIVQELADRWNQINLTVEEGVEELTTLCATEVLVGGEPRCNKIPQPRPSVEQLLKAASVCLPEVLPCKGIRVASRKKLPENRLTP